VGRCECGRELIGATLQTHQKLGPIFITVCVKSNLPPKECTELSIVHVRRIANRKGAFNVIVDDKIIGGVATLDSMNTLSGWTWWLTDSRLPFNGIAPDRDSAVKQVLDKCTT